MLNIIFFSLYLLISLIVFSIIILVFVRTRDTLVYDRESLTRIVQIFVGLLFFLAVFGGYEILTGDIFPKRAIDTETFIHL